jgi:hypothetical protein
MQPATDAVMVNHLGRFAHQHQKGCLVGIVSIMAVAEHPSANAMNHGAVPPHQAGESFVVISGDVLLQQLAVGRPIGAGASDAIDVAN